MNRFFAAAGFLAAGMAGFFAWFILCLPWMGLIGSHNAPRSSWLLWAAASALLVALLAAFLRWSLRSHWHALLRNAPLPVDAWRGVCGIYLFLAPVFAMPAFADDPSGTHRTERWLYLALTACSLALGIFAARKGVRGQSA